ncbi:EAL domain-containing protein [Ferrimicrobium acidiphilum]|jgi:EAL domain-containing protein (putative c-di-GMP-specific phosphodiesterase class I)|nr:EAL domain-containing protein [Ferrimicrobium acidiphilum]
MGKGRPRFGVIDGLDTIRNIEDTRQDVLKMREYVREILTGERSFSMRFQSIANVFGPRVVGYEMLTRFDLPTNIGPDQIFLEADAIGLGAELEALILARAFKERRRVPRDCFVTVNVSPHLLGQPILRSVFDRDLSGVVVELTEHVRIVDIDALRDSLTWLRARGALIAMDDAGSGYAGLQMITQVRPDIVKLDRELVSGIDTDEVKALICASFGDFVGRLNGWLLAEGVETQAELARVVQIGVPLVQGWVIGRPTLQPEPLRADLAEWLRSYGESRQIRLDCLTILMDPVLIETETSQPTSDESTPDVAIRSGETPADALVADAAMANTAICVVSPNRDIRRVLLPDSSGVRVLAMSMVAHPEEGIREVAVRAINRPIETRFDPIVCVNENREPVGIIRMERIINFLADVFADGGSIVEGVGLVDGVGNACSIKDS